MLLQFTIIYFQKQKKKKPEFYKLVSIIFSVFIVYLYIYTSGVSKVLIRLRCKGQNENRHTTFNKQQHTESQKTTTFNLTSQNSKQYLFVDSPVAKFDKILNRIMCVG